MEIEQVLFPSNFFNCRIQLLGGCFKRVHTIRQLDPTQSDPTKLDRVNAPLTQLVIYFSSYDEEVASSAFEKEQSENPEGRKFYHSHAYLHFAANNSS